MVATGEGSTKPAERTGEGSTKPAERTGEGSAKPAEHTGKGSTGPGTARDALAVTAFRRIYVASFLSNMGRWMQTVAVGVLGWELTGSNAYLGQLIFAQLVPMAFLSLLGGSLADSMDRRVLLAATQTWQMGFTALLTILLLDGEIGRTTLLVIVFLTGLGQGIYAPVFTSVLPSLVGIGNLAAAVSLNSVQVNAARVIGPAAGGFLVSRFGFAEVFGLNAVSYLAVIAAVLVTHFPRPVTSPRPLQDRLLGGFLVARRSRQVGRPIAVMTLFSLLCLPFIGQLPAIAEQQLGIDARSTAYGYFYAVFGVGALLGAALVGTVLLRTDKVVILRSTLALFGVSLAALSTVARLPAAYLVIFSVGLFYFAVPTTLNTFWQQHVDESIRGRVSALWVLSFGGTVPIANLVAGPVVEWTSLRAVMLFGAVTAAAIAVILRIPPGPVVGEELLDSGRRSPLWRPRRQPG